MMSTPTTRLNALRLAKTKAVTNFTRLKFQLLELIHEEEIINKAEMKRLRSQFDETMQSTMSALEKYLEECTDEEGQNSV